MSGLLLILLALTLGYFVWSRRHLYRLTWKFGGRLGYPLVGSFFDHLDVQDFGAYLVNVIWAKNKSPCPIWLGSTLHMAIRDADYAQMVLSSNELLNKHIMYQVFYPATGKTSIISSKADLWKVQRRILDPTLNYKRVHNLIPAFNKAIDAYINNTLRPVINKGQVNIHSDLIALIMELTVENVAGQNLKWLDKQSGFSVLGTFNKIQHHVEDRTNKVYLHSDFIYGLTKGSRKIYNEVQHLHEIFQKLVIENFSSDSLLYTTGGVSICDTLRKHTGKEGFSDHDNRFQMATFIMAGYETTAFTLSLVLCYMAMYPDCQEKLFEELISCFPEKYPKVEADTLNELPYLEMVICEVLRLHPSVPMVGRAAIRDTTLRDGTFIPKGVQFIIDLISLQRNEKYWGPDANKFNPDNFLPENRENRHPQAFIPFSFGPRNCIGTRYAKVLMKIAVAKLFRTFKFTTSWKMEDVQYRRGIAMQIVKPPLIAVEERSC